VDQEKLRAWWASKQGLLTEDTSLTVGQVFSRYGWCRSVAGCNPYLTAFSRSGHSRTSVDDAVRELEISELPAARSCTYIVPRADFSVALTLAENNGAGEKRTAIQLGATPQELDLLCEKTLLALKDGPLDPAGLKPHLGDAIRNFGEEGKKKGLGTSLPVALGILQAQGKIVRRPVSGRLDEQRYQYEAWADNPPRPEDFSSQSALVILAEHFFRWIGPATLGEFSQLAGISNKRAKEAVLRLGLVSLPDDPEKLFLPQEIDSFQSFSAPKEPIYRLVNRLDSLILLHDDYSVLLSADSLKKMMELQIGTTPGRAFNELGYNPILDRGSVVGLWEFDANRQEIVSSLFGQEDAALSSEIAKTEIFVRDQLGDARTFSLDSPKSRQPKIDRLRAKLAQI
jgi:hypothetical protein